MIEKLAAAIYNDVVGGLAGTNSNPAMSLSQLEDDIVDERLQIIKEYSLKNLIPKKDLLMGIHCIDVDCKSLDKCPCSGPNYSTPIAHFEIPQIVNDLAAEAIEYIGSIDRKIPFKVFTSTAYQYDKYARRGGNKPTVYIETTPNENNMYDGWIFNAPLLEKLSIIAIFKDPRQLSAYGCCSGDEIDNYTFIATEIKKRLTEKKLRYYRQFLPNPLPNTQVAR
jgi:hypothetical protein